MYSTSSISPVGVQWNIDANGFLRINDSNCMRAGVLDYAREELLEQGVEIPDWVIGDTIGLYVDLSEIQDPESLKSLEGVPVLLGHEWLDALDIAEGNNDKDIIMGSISGKPQVIDGFVKTEQLINDARGVNGVVSKKLVDLSAAYIYDIVWEPGKFNDVAYHGKQVKLRYNHVGLLPEGRGRAGKQVRVFNKKPESKEVPKMAEENYTSVHIKGLGTIRVHSQDVKALNEYAEKAENNEAEVEAKNISLADAEAKLAELTSAQEELAAAQDKVNTLSGELQGLKDQLEAAMNPETIQQEAVEIANQRDEAAKAMNADSLPDDMKNLIGVDLKRAVVQHVRAENKLPALSEDNLNDDSFVNGIYTTIVDGSGSPKKPGKVAGSNVVTSGLKAQNQQGDGSSSDRFNKLYGSKGKEGE